FQSSVQTLDCDLSETGTAESIFDFCQKNNLQVEVLVNNAGMLNKIIMRFIPLIPHVLIRYIYRKMNR
ncbi:MAG: hypothetical protein DRJ13_04830, partial [Bacteroidetes bacterium]